MTSKAYAAYHKSQEVLQESSSGAVFTALSDFILDNHGIIIGGGMTIPLTH